MLLSLKHTVVSKPTASGTMDHSKRRINCLIIYSLLLQLLWAFSVLLAAGPRLADGQICSPGTTARYGQQCTSGLGDVAIVLGGAATGSSFDVSGQIAFAQGIISTLDVDQSSTRLAVVSAGAIYIGYNSDVNASVANDRLENITVLSGSVQQHLSFMLNVVMRSVNGHRANQPDTIILLVDGPIDANDGVSEASALTSAGVTLAVAGTTSNSTTYAQLTPLTISFSSWSTGLDLVRNAESEANVPASNPPSNFVDAVTARSPQLCSAVSLVQTGCSQCTCDPRGSQSLLCSETSGQCPCKANVVGLSCDRCAVGFDILDIANPVGCSGVPQIVNVSLQQLSQGQVLVAWYAGEDNAGPVVLYEVLRGDSLGSSAIVYTTANPDARTFIDTQLVQGSAYTYTVRASTSGGASLSVPTYITILGELSPFLSVPTLSNVTATTAVISWERLNSDPVAYYQVLINEQVYEQVNSSESSLLLIDLLPYNVYSAIVRACLAAGDICISSNRTNWTTDPSAPGQVLAPTVSAGPNGTTLLVSWSAAGRQNGILAGYRIYYQQITGPSSPSRGCNHVVIDTSCNITGLTPTTAYLVWIEVENLPPVISTTNSTATRALTSDALPSGLPIPSMSAIAATSVTVTFTPVIFGGANIVAYAVVVDDNASLSVSIAGSYSLPGLSPFTTYAIAVRACTTGGCVDGPTAFVTTAAAPPTGQQPPRLSPLAYTASSGSAVRLRWGLPLHPNGVIRQFQITRVQFPQSTSQVLASVSVSNINTYLDENLTANARYGYSITAISDDGESTSTVEQVTTSSAPPMGLSQPSTVPLEGGISVALNWSAPQFPNGETVRYMIELRNYSSNDEQPSAPWVGYVGTATSFIVSGLTPSSVYDVRATFNNNIGSVTSSWSNFTTLSTPPDTFELAPVMVSKTDNSMTVAWFAEQRMNGVLTSGTIVIETTRTTFTRQNAMVGGPSIEGEQEISSLEPNTQYSVLIELCNSAGCTQSPAVSVTTSGRAPDRIVDLSAFALSSSEVQLEWSTPDSPNMPIGAFQILRGSIRIFTGTIDTLREQYPSVSSRHVFRDRLLQSSTQYTYTVRTYTEFGSSASNLAFATTLAQTPTDISSPNVTVLNGTAINVFWDEHSEEMLQYSIIVNNQVDLCISDRAGQCTLTRFNSGSIVRVQQKVCVPGGGCGYSVAIVVQTDDALPEGVDDPQWSYVSSASELYVSWDEPMQSNGVVSYELLVQGNFRNSSGYEEALSLIAANNETLSYFDLLIPEIHANPLPITNGSIIVFDGSSSTTLLHVGEEVGTSFTIIAEFVQSNAGSSEGQCLFEKSNGFGSIFYSLYIQPNRRLYFYYRVRGSSAMRVVAFGAQLPTGIVQRIMLAINGPFATLTINGIRLLPIRLEGLVDDCGGGAAESNCQIQLGSRGAVTALNRPTSLFFNGAVSRLEIYATDALIAYPNDTISSTLQTLNLPRNFVESATKIVYSGSERFTTIEGLLAFEPYVLQLRAVTRAGFSSSSLIRATTRASIPEGVNPPSVVPVSFDRVLVVWNPPDSLNGPLVRYELEQKQYNEATGHVIYVTTSSDPREMRHMIFNLTAFARYQFLVGVVVGAADGTNRTLKSVSAWVNYTTPETSPGGVDGGLVSNLSSVGFTLSWSAPANPNGVLLRYNIFINQAFVRSLPAIYDRELLSTQQTSFTGLLMDRDYTLAIQACTAAGCTTSAEQTVTVPLGAPLPIAVRPTTILPRGILLSWTAVSTTDRYILVRSEEGSSRSTTLNDTLRFDVVNATYSDFQLEPGTVYQYLLIGINRIGYTEGPWVNVQTLRVAPEGMGDLFIIFTDARSLNASWPVPIESWGATPRYQLTAATANQSARQIYAGSSNSVQVNNVLQPATNYNFTLLACVDNTLCSASEVVSRVTPEDVPMGFDAVTVSELQPRSFTVIWDSPLQSNGILLPYWISIHSYDAEIREYRVDGSLNYLFVNDTTPFMNYTIYIAACTAVGCTDSVSTSFTTPQAPPEGMDAPHVTALIGGSSFSVEWEAPQILNGVLSSYYVEYRASNSSDPLPFSRISAANTTELVVQDLDGNTQYEVRIVAATQGGEAITDSSFVRTHEGVPRGVPALEVERIVNDSRVDFLLAPPESVNGFVTGIFILSDQGLSGLVSISVSSFGTVTIGNLTAGIMYNFTARVCTVAGCALGPTISLKTANESIPEGVARPIIRTATTNEIIVAWESPSAPHGMIQSYELIYSINRNRTNITLNTGQNQSATISGLIPYQLVTAIVRACTSIGCGDGPFTALRSAEDVPEDLAAPNVTAIYGGRTIQVEWNPARIANGNVSYTVHTNHSQGSQVCDNVGCFGSAGVQPDGTFETFIQEVSPLSTVAVFIQGCTSAGCVDSNTTIVTMGEGTPDGLNSPALSVLSSTLIQIRWIPPTSPNGVLQLYQILRNGAIIYSSAETNILQFDDTDLLPNTTYRYNLLAGTSVGNTTSLVTSATTFIAIPELLLEPNCTTESDSSIHVSWAAPLRPNGVITNHSLLMVDAEANGVTYIGSTSAATSTEFTATDLEGFLSYTFVYQACINTGCALSPPCSAETLRGLPAQINPPRTSAFNTSTIQIEWDAPGRPNAELLGYVLMYRIVDPGYLGVEVTTNEFTELFSSGITTRVTAQTGLGTYAAVEYKYIVINQIGNGTSPIVLGRSGEGVPIGMGTPTIANMSATYAVLQWSPPTYANGVITYTIESQDERGQITTATNLTSINVTDLLPTTFYTFQLIATTSAGSTEGGNVTRRTEEGAPTAVSSPVAVAINSTAFRVSWDAPGRANGILTEFALLMWQAEDTAINATRVCIGLITSCVVDNLSPFTTYDFMVRVCTVGGCGDSIHSNSTTAEGLPSGFDSPVSSAVSSNQLTLTWAPPARPNGVITHYLVYALASDNTTSNDSGTYPVPNFNDEPVGRVVSDSPLRIILSDLLPFTNYSLAVQAFNGAGSIYAPVTSITTDVGIPSVVQFPRALGLSSGAIRVSWNPPTLPNGPNIRYSVLWSIESMDGVDESDDNSADGSGDDYQDSGASLPQTSLSYDISSLRPNTVYEVTILSISEVGSSATSISNRTCSSTPSVPRSLSVVSSNANSISIDWQAPQSLNGLLLRYETEVSGTSNSTGLSTQTTVSNLRPFTTYLIGVRACVTGSCGDTFCSDLTSTSANTSAMAPQGLAAATAVATGPRSIDVSWSSPLHPNGPILFYLLARGTQNIYNGSAYEYQDTTGLTSGTAYNYTVTAVGLVGSVTNAPTLVATQSIVPMIVRPVESRFITSDRIVVSWIPPLRQSAPINRYQLFLNNTLVWQGLDRTAVLTGSITPNTVFSIELAACVVLFGDLDCTRSVPTVVRTSCSEPSLPTLTLTATTTHSLSCNWTIPLSLGCDSVSYQIEYENVLSFQSRVVSPLFNYSTDRAGDTVQININDLVPGTSYALRLIVINSVDSIEGNWIYQNTSESAPSGVFAPSLVSIPSGFVVAWSLPTEPNGVILYYLLYRDNDLVTNSTSRVVEVSGLPAASGYAFRVEACTSAGCGSSSEVQGDVSPQVIANLPTPTIAEVEPTRVFITWPSIIGANFSFRMRYCISTVSCVNQESVVSSISQTPTGNVAYLAVEPSKMYELQLVAINDAGESRSNWTGFSTPGLLTVGNVTPHCTIQEFDPINYTATLRCDVSAVFVPVELLDSLTVEWIGATSGQLEVSLENSSLFQVAFDLNDMIPDELYNLNFIGTAGRQLLAVNTTFEFSLTTMTTKTSITPSVFTTSTSLEPIALAISETETVSGTDLIVYIVAGILFLVLLAAFIAIQRSKRTKEKFVPESLIIVPTDPFWITDEDGIEHLPIVQQYKPITSPRKKVMRDLVIESPRIRHVRNPERSIIVTKIVDSGADVDTNLFEYKFPPKFVPEAGDDDITNYYDPILAISRSASDLLDFGGFEEVDGAYGGPPIIEEGGNIHGLDGFQDQDQVQGQGLDGFMESNALPMESEVLSGFVEGNTKLTLPTIVDANLNTAEAKSNEGANENKIEDKTNLITGSNPNSSKVDGEMEMLASVPPSGVTSLASDMSQNLKEEPALRVQVAATEVNGVRVVEHDQNYKQVVDDVKVSLETSNKSATPPSLVSIEGDSGNWAVLETERSQRKVMATDMNESVTVDGYDQIGVIKYYGPHRNEPSKMRIGIEFESPIGRNSGSIKGFKYFNCRPRHGAFVTPSKAKLLARDGPSDSPIRNILARNPSELTEDPIAISLDNSGELGIKLCGPKPEDADEGRGVWVCDVKPGTIAGDSGQVCRGQQVLSVNENDTRSSNKEKVMKLIKASKTQVTLALQYNPVQYQLFDDGLEYKAALERFRNDLLEGATAQVTVEESNNRAPKNTEGVIGEEDERVSGSVSAEGSEYVVPDWRQEQLEAKEKEELEILEDLGSNKHGSKRSLSRSMQKRRSSQKSKESAEQLLERLNSIDEDGTDAIEAALKTVEE